MSDSTKTPAPRAERGLGATKVGVVVSDRMQKTRVVAVERMVRHAGYKRIVRRTSRFHAHDERNDARLGDQVEIVETRPLSRLKRWRIARIIARAPGKERLVEAIPGADVLEAPAAGAPAEKRATKKPGGVRP